MISEKAALREEAKRRRAGCDPADGARMALHVLRDCMPPPGAIIGGYWPMRHEIDPRHLLHALAKSHQITLPETPLADAPLIFRKWQPGDPLARGRFNTSHPHGPELAPDFILVPLLAFDQAGNRLGYGGGFYDRTLAALPGAFRLGCAYAAQQMPAIPVDWHDLPMHAIATEKAVAIYDKKLLRT